MRRDVARTDPSTHLTGRFILGPHLGGRDWRALILMAGACLLVLAGLQAGFDVLQPIWETVLTLLGLNAWRTYSSAYIRHVRSGDPEIMIRAGVFPSIGGAIGLLVAAGVNSDRPSHIAVVLGYGLGSLVWMAGSKLWRAPQTFPLLFGTAGGVMTWRFGANVPQSISYGLACYVIFLGTASYLATVEPRSPTVVSPNSAPIN